jgi:3-deoxy-D-manno-octulosonic-acid transferase
MKKSHPFWFLAYNLVILPALYFGAQIAGLFNHKVRESIRGRRGLTDRLREIKSKLPANRKVIIIHSASAGEFEAAKPILAAIRHSMPHLHIHVTCYSPSGMRPILKADNLDSFSYLPLDDYFSVRRFFRILKPVAFIFVKHDVWPNIVWAAARYNVPCLWVNANLHQETKRLNFYARGLNRSFLDHLSVIMTVDESHALRLAQLADPARIEVAGDSRYDRTLARAGQIDTGDKKAIPPGWFAGKKALVGGSTWGPDQRILAPAYAHLKKRFPDLFLVLVPHEPHDEFLADTELYLRGFELQSVRLSQLNGELPVTDALIVDRLGILAAIYRNAWVAYIGGAFGEGVHSVLEPAVFGLPLFFGPRYYMSHEAQALVERGAAHSISTTADFENKLLTFLLDKEAHKKASTESRQLVQRGSGATLKILERLEQLMAKGN